MNQLYVDLIEKAMQNGPRRRFDFISKRDFLEAVRKQTVLLLISPYSIVSFRSKPWVNHQKLLLNQFQQVQQLPVLQIPLFFLLMNMLKQS